MIIQKQIRIMPRVFDIYSRVKYHTVSAWREGMIDERAFPYLASTAYHHDREGFAELVQSAG